MPDRDKQRSIGVQRHRVTRDQDCSLGVISFENLERIDYQAKILDLSVIGIGIESPKRIPPGIIWFRKCVSGQKYGTLVWCKEIGGAYRAGIQFLTLSREEEDYITRQIEEGHPNEPVSDPDHIVSQLIDVIKKEREHSAGQSR
ncbi:MAG TPA: PilZ domain-containing protein [Nitrospirota bacterium]|nr:PilZ domain-containing protein [Nitrospirota bacterium]